MGAEESCLIHDTEFVYGLRFLSIFQAVSHRSKQTLTALSTTTEQRGANANMFWDSVMSKGPGRWWRPRRLNSI